MGPLALAVPVGPPVPPLPHVPGVTEIGPAIALTPLN
jgi:hypothetical protein